MRESGWVTGAVGLGIALAISLGNSIGFAGEYETDLEQERREKDHEIRMEQIGPFTAIGQASLRSSKALRVAVRPDTLLLNHPTADVGIPTLEVTWKEKAGQVYLRTPMGGEFHLGRQKIGPVPTLMQPGDTLRTGRFLLQVYRSTTSARIMAFDTAHPLRSSFTGLNYFPVDQEWAVEARVERIADPETIPLATSLGLAKDYRQHSRLHFSAPDGSEHTLMLYVPSGGEPYGFVPFGDTSNGEESYGAGRYLDLEPPADGQETLVVDFNRAYNPYCAFTEHYNCPIPPAENQLSFPVKAGEKRYK